MTSTSREMGFQSFCFLSAFALSSKNDWGILGERDEQTTNTSNTHVLIIGARALFSVKFHVRTFEREIKIVNYKGLIGLINLPRDCVEPPVLKRKEL